MEIPEYLAVLGLPTLPVDLDEYCFAFHRPEYSAANEAGRAGYQYNGPSLLLTIPFDRPEQSSSNSTLGRNFSTETARQYLEF